MVRASFVAVLVALLGGCVIAEAISLAVCENDYEACAEACEEIHPQDPDRREQCHLECDEQYDACISDCDDCDE